MRTTIGEELGVRAVLKGRVTQRGDTLDISAELIDARDNSHIWGQQYSRPASDIFALQNDLAREITTNLRMRLSGDDERRMARRYTASSDAYQDYMRGRFWWNRRGPEAAPGASNSSSGPSKKIRISPWPIPAWPMATATRAPAPALLPMDVYPQGEGGRPQSAAD